MTTRTIEPGSEPVSQTPGSSARDNMESVLGSGLISHESQPTFTQLGMTSNVLNGPMETALADSTTNLVMTRNSEITSMTFSTPEITKAAQTPLPRIKVERAAHSYLVGDMAHIMEGIQAIVYSHAMLSRVTIRSLSVTTRHFRDPHKVELKFTVQTENNMEQSLAFWEAIGVRLYDWGTRLRPKAKRLLEEDIGVSVEWKD